MTLPDLRIPVRFGTLGDFRWGDAVLIEGDGLIPPPGIPAQRFRGGPATGHPAGCACCVPRSEAATALHRLYLARARTSGSAFSSVLVLAQSGAGRRAVEDAIAADAALGAWFLVKATHAGSGSKLN